MNPYLPLAMQAGARYGVRPELLIAQLRQESRFNPKAVSPAGARGIAQFMPATWKEYGGGADPFDPAAGIDAQARYMRDLLRQFGGNEALALAAYNAGPGRVRKAGGVPDIQETRDYVRRILGAGPDVRTAGTDDLPRQMQTPGDPRTGRAAQMFPPNPLMTQPGGMGQDPMAAYQPPQMSMLQSMAQNPWLQMGLAGMGNPQGGNGNWMAGLTGGMQQGLMAASLAQQQQQRLDLAMAQAFEAVAEKREKKRRADEIQAVADQIADPIERELFLRDPRAYVEHRASTGYADAAAGLYGTATTGGGGMYQEPPSGYGVAVGSPMDDPQGGGPAVQQEAAEMPRQTPIGPGPGDALIDAGRRAIQTGHPEFIKSGQEDIRKGMELNAAQQAKIDEEARKEALEPARMDREVDLFERKEQTKKQVNARDMLPAAESVAAQAVEHINELRNHPSFRFAVGPIEGMLPGTPASPGVRDFVDRLEQVRGGAFLQAREFLKGAGQITDFESRRAEAAFARMNRATGERHFMAALDDFEAAVKAGVTKIRKQAGLQQSDRPAAAGSGYSDEDYQRARRELGLP